MGQSDAARASDVPITMKFGKNLHRNQVPEWAAFYINYKGLKKIIKGASVALSRGEPVVLDDFFALLDRNLEDIESFYNRKLDDARQRLGRLRDQYGNVPEAREPFLPLNRDETEELVGALFELRRQFRNLQWYGEINRKGFVKILKKLDKKVPNAPMPDRPYIETRVDSKMFSKGSSTAPHLEEINKWLSALFASLEASGADDTSSVDSRSSLGRASGRGGASVPQATLDALEQAARADDVVSLEANLDSIPIDMPAVQHLLLGLLQRSISSRSMKCIDHLLGKVDYLGPDDISGRNCIHRLVIYIGKTKTQALSGHEPSSFPLQNVMQLSSQFLQPAASPAPAPKPLNENETTLLSRDDEAVQLLIHILDKLSPNQRGALKSIDSLGRLPIHFAAHFGFVVLCEIIMEKMKAWGQFGIDDGIGSPGWLDKDGHGPLHLSIMGGHPKTTQALLAMGQTQTCPDGSVIHVPISNSGALLALATKANFGIIVKMLLETGIDINWQDEAGETALHVAARFEHPECARVLIEGTEDQKADIEIVESTYGWTPLDVAAVDGNTEVVKVLIDAGADIAKEDSSGWTAQEHAALRGHAEIARLLRSTTSLSAVERRDASGTISPLEDLSTEDRHLNGVSSSVKVELTRSFGHQFLTNESLVLVSLGSMDMRKMLEAVMLEKVPLNEAHYTGLDTALSVVVSAINAEGQPAKIDLPVNENIATEPIVFRATDVSKVAIIFDIVPTYSGNEEDIIGRAAARLSSVRPTVGTMRMNLQGDVAVPIIGLRKSTALLGTVHFNFLVVKPFSHPNMDVNSKQTYWKRLSGPMVIGHRGLGKNTVSTRSLQLGENTVPSLIAAANLGAQYVEFDVQLTKDHVPVIYHDFLVSETGIDAPVHTLTLEQFLHINPDSARRSGHDQQSAGSRIKKRSNSLDFRGTKGGFGEMDRDHPDMDERMKHTRDFKTQGYKGNSRGNFIQAPFATLEDLFRQIPENVGFNIEVKYPMLHESEEQEMDTFAVEINEFCDTVLAKVYEMAGNRRILFSSFNPDICLCLGFKQPSFPVMFLTDAGTSPVGDVRASSLQEAIRFASRWDLLGIVSAAELFVLCPRLIKVIKERGLVCVSYGALNNNSQIADRQFKQGIDAVIVDSVLAIRKGLTSHGSRTPSDEGGESPSVLEKNIV